MSAENAPAVSVVIPVWNKWAYTSRCLQRLRENTTDVSHEVIVVDNGSTDETAAELSGRTDVRYHRNDSNRGFARAVNQGARLARGRYLLFLNNDTEPLPGWLAAMVAVAEQNPRVAIVGCKLLFPNGTIQHGGVVFAYASPEPITPFHFDYRQPADARNRILDLRAVTAACMLVRPEVFASVGGLDEAFVNGYEDVDFCLKVWSAGGKIIYTPDAVVVHHESVSDGRFKHQADNIDRLNALWMDRFSAYEIDFRRTAKPAFVDPRRPGASIVVIAEQSLATIAPCLENILYAAGAQDEIVVVDNGSTGAARRFAELFAARNPQRVRVVRSDRRLDAGAALRLGVGQASGPDGHPYTALVGQNVKVVTGWLDRMIGHLAANATLGAVTASLGRKTALSEKELLAPPDLPDPATCQPRARPAGEVVRATVAASGVVVAHGDRLRALLSGAGDDLFSADPDSPGALAAALAGQGLALGRAADVTSYRFDETRGHNDPAVMERYLERQSAAIRAGAATGRVAIVVIGPTETFGAAYRRALAPSVEIVAVVSPEAVVPDDGVAMLGALLETDPTIALVGPVGNGGAGPQSVPDVPYHDLAGTAVYASRWRRHHRGEYSFADRLLPFCVVLRRHAVDQVGGPDATGALDDLTVRLSRAGYRAAVSHDVFVHRGPAEPNTAAPERTGWSESRIHTGPVRRFAVSILRQPGNIHSECFREVAEAMNHQLWALGHDCQLAGEVDVPDRTNIIFGANLLANLDQPVDFRPGSILFNLEQIYQGSPWLTPVVMEAFRRHVVWDYSLANVRVLATMGVTAHHVPIGYAPTLTRITPSPAPDIDVLFIGSQAPRRMDVLTALNQRGARVVMINGAYGSERDALIARAKLHLNIHFHPSRVFEIVRVSYLLANRGFVVSEEGSEGEEERSFSDGVVFVPYEQLIETCLRYLDDPAGRETIAARGFELMCRRSTNAELRAAIAAWDNPRTTASG